MHRVELKDTWHAVLQDISGDSVPNAPCGVERRAINPPAINGCGS